MLAGSMFAQPPVVRKDFLSPVAKQANADRVSTWARTKKGSNVTWVAFNKKVPSRIDHSREAALHLAQLATHRLLTEIESYSELDEGWDGPRSYPPSASAIQAAAYFVKQLRGWARLPDVSVAPDGEISIHWIDSGSYIDISFQGDLRVIMYGRIEGTIFKGFAEQPFNIALAKVIEDHIRLV